MVQTGKTIRETVVVGPDCREQILLMQTPALAYLQRQGIGFSGLGPIQQDCRERNYY